LESWSDGRSYEGTVTIQQPLIQPLYDSHSAHEVLDALINPEPRPSYAIVQAYWQSQLGEADFATAWATALHDGLITDSALPAKAVTLQVDFAAQSRTSAPTDELEVTFAPDPTIWDGRFANNGWLQELPKPITKLTWENAVLINPQTADSLSLTQGDLVEVTTPAGGFTGPVWLFPGQAAGVLTVHLGYGRTAAGVVGNEAGFSAYGARPASEAWFVSAASVRKVGAGHPFATTQGHHSMEGRHLIRVGTVAEFAANPAFAQALDGHGEVISLYPKYEYPDNAWGMTVDLTSCIGCNACVTACQAENNIPIVGKAEVINGREMHWIRIDTYFEGETLDQPAVHHQPVMCMHCETAPCEVVCPVAATVHDAEGLNTMVYNRCVGTRYCSNNCPYKVRRFNFLDYSGTVSDSVKLQYNPNVTVRARGVMEKCTYCVQRISAARIRAQIEGREIADGEVVTACQAACPTQAITFGNLNDPTSAVAQRKASPLNYGLLTELNTSPRTSYLAKLRNPNPALAS
jgi:Fe-S-cluster-containing dehydrogenase component